MNHFDISDWTDFVRGCASAADRMLMESHLATGCRRCGATAELMKRVAASSRADNLYDPPADVVRCAKALSPLQRPRSSMAGMMARLVYDSFRDPLPAGLRAGDRISRHTVFEAGDFLLDLRAEQDKEAQVVTLVGQVTNRTDPDKPLDKAPVLVMARKEVIAHALYNRFGEFQMDYPPARHLRLCVALAPPGKRIEVSLNRLAATQLEGNQAGGSHVKNT